MNPTLRLHRYREILMLVGKMLLVGWANIIPRSSLSYSRLPISEETQYLVLRARRLNEEDELMKKRTSLVCFLIFTLCVFYTAIPNTVFGQEEEASLAQKVSEKYKTTLEDPDVKSLLPDVLAALSDPATLENPLIAQLGGFEAAVNLLLANPVLIRQVVPDASDGVIALLSTEPIQTMFKDPDVLTLMQDSEAVKEFAALLASPPDDGTTPPPDDGTTPPPDDGTTPPDDGTTPPDDGTTPPPDDGTTPPPDDGTTPPPDDGTTPPPIVEPPDPEQPIVEPPGEEVTPASPFDSIIPADESIYGRSKLGGLSLNRFLGKWFVNGFISLTNIEGHTPESLVDLILKQVPPGLLSKEQMKSIRYGLTSRSISIFDNEASQLDFENFGNPILPKPVELGYLDVPNTKYLTRDNLNLYVRVPLPATKVGGVKFMLQSGTGDMHEQMVDVSSETVSHTFELDESFAAGHLPAWPTSSTGVFSDVKLRYSYERLGAYPGEMPMTPEVTNKGVTWKTAVDDIPLGSNVYYYFEVTLAEPVTLDILSRSKLLALSLAPPDDPADLLKAVAEATLDPPIEITRWMMPDPRNLQTVERGLLEHLLTPEVVAAIDRFTSLPGVQKLVDGEKLTPGENRAIMRGLNRLQIPLLLSVDALLRQIESTTDPMLASVFSVPAIDPQSESLWVANIDSIADNNYYLAATVHDAAGSPLDQIQEQFTVDTTAPEATIAFSPELNATGYWNSKEGVYVATAPDPDKPAALNIRGMPKYALDAGESYLMFQEAELDTDGNFQNTWMPLTIQSTMASSKLLQAALSQNPALLRPYVGNTLTDEQILGLIETVTPDLILGMLTPEIIQTQANAFLEQSGIPFQLNEYQSAVIHDILGFTFKFIDTLLPVSFDFVPGEGYAMTMPIQGDGMPLAIGDYGIRALGIDTLFNINASAPHARLRIVMPEYDKASVTAAVIGDCNGDGDTDDLFESGSIGDVTIFGNTTENVMLTVTVDQRSAHPATVMVQYMDAAGEWQNIGELDLAGTETGSTLTTPWNVTDFDALIAAGSSVMVRAVATNALRFTDPAPTAGSINLDADICPLDPEVVAITVDPPTATNPDSGGPQGTRTLNAYTPRRTSTDIESVRLVAKGPQDAEWTIESESSELAGDISGQALAGILGDLVSTVASEKPVLNIDSTYRKWVITIDTTELEDTITADSPAARDASKDENQYVVMGYVNTNGTEIPPIPGVEARFSVDNVDDVAPLGPTNVSVTGVEATDSVFEASEDGSGYTVGGLVDKYDEAVASPIATFTIEPTADRKTYESVRLVTDVENLVIGEVTETAEGSGVFTVTVDVGTLADGETYLENGTYMFHALASDEAGNEQADESETDGSKISVAVENSYRPAPEVLAITTDPAAETNPDSGAPRGIITLNSYTLGETTSPPLTSMRFEIKRRDADDSEWTEVGTTTESSAVTSEELEELQQQNVDFLSDLLAVAAETAAVTSGEVSPIHRYQAYQKWSVSIDTTPDGLGLEDTIDAESPAARDASLDANPYVVRVIAVSAADEGETMSPDGVESTFSLDNVDDVPPLGPTNIVAVEDVMGMIEANEDGSYTVGGIVDDSVLSPWATFTIEQTADPITYEGGSVNLVQTTADGTETIIEGDPGVLNVSKKIDVGMLENGTYMFHALTVDEAGNVQMDESPKVTVHVVNFRVADVSDIAVIAVDGTDVAEAPTAPIPLRRSVTVSLMVANGSLAAEELSGAAAGQDMSSESAEDPENTFSLMVEVGALPDGVYTANAKVTKRNGDVEFPVAEVKVDNLGPMVTIESPTDGEAVESLPTVHASYHDGEGSGTDKDGKEVLAWATTELGDGPTLGITRVQPEQGNIDVEVDQNVVEADNGTLVYTRTERLPGGAYTITVQVADVLGNVGTGKREFVINGTAPAVVIHSPSAAQTFEHGAPLISGEFSGAGTVEVTTFTINGVDATPTVEENRFSYTPEEALGDGDHTVVVAVTDADGNTAQTSVTFTVKMPKDTTPPIISATGPHGIIKDTDPETLGKVKISAVVTDEQSAVSSVGYRINAVNETDYYAPVAGINIAGGKIDAPIDFTKHGPGLYRVDLRATSEGGTTHVSWTFTLVLDKTAPTITSITPSGTVRGGAPVISASANDESGVAKITIAVIDSDGKAVKGKTQDDAEDSAPGITRLDFNPEAPLEEGVYTIQVRATDTLGNSSTAAGNFTVDFDTAAPVITMSSPQQDARFMLKPGDKAPTVSIAYTDAESGINVDSIVLVMEGPLALFKSTSSGTKIPLTSEQKSANQLTYTLPLDTNTDPKTWAGEYVVRFEVADNAHLEGNVSEKNKGARKANTAVHTFSFFVEAVKGPIMASPPINFPNPFKDSTKISFALVRRSTMSMVIYDSTLRPVRVLMDNEVRDAGDYTGKNAVHWDGKTSGGEDLARGVYFCQIILTDGIEPQYALLKLALTR